MDWTDWMINVQDQAQDNRVADDTAYAMVLNRLKVADHFRQLGVQMQLLQMCCNCADVM